MTNSCHFLLIYHMIINFLFFEVLILVYPLLETFFSNLFSFFISRIKNTPSLTAGGVLELMSWR